MTIAIRQATESDGAVLDRLIDILGFHKEEGYVSRCLEEQAAGRRAIFIAAQDGADAGYGMLNFHPRYALYARLGLWEIQDLNVVPAARRRGVASAVIAHCESRARAQGHDAIGISVGLYPAYGPAQRLYAKLGYLPDGCGVTYDRQPVQPGEIRPVDDDLCLMLVRDLAWNV